MRKEESSFPVADWSVPGPEKTGVTELFRNYSGKPLQEIIHYFPPDLHADKIVVMPDFNPSKAPLPTGCSVEIDEVKQPDWRKYTLSDIGCGMQVLQTPLTWDDFENNHKKWDTVREKLLENKGGLGDLGSGNHFLDAAVDQDQRLHFVIHTGSRDKSKDAESVIDNPSQFEETYKYILGWAKKNRDTIRDVVEDQYGGTDFVLDKSHNFYDRKEGKVVIYKGSVQLKEGEETLIPSNMDGEMVLVEGTDKVEDLNGALAHGTGRRQSRSENKEESRSYDFSSLRKRIFISDAVADQTFLTEIPPSYRDLDACLELIQDLVIVKKSLYPIAYIGRS